MLAILFLCVILIIIHRRHGLSATSVGLALTFGAIIAIFLGPPGGICGVIAWAILSPNKGQQPP